MPGQVGQQSQRLGQHGEAREFIAFAHHRHGHQIFAGGFRETIGIGGRIDERNNRSEAASRHRLGEASAVTVGEAQIEACKRDGVTHPGLCGSPALPVALR